MGILLMGGFENDSNFIIQFWFLTKLKKYFLWFWGIYKPNN